MIRRNNKRGLYESIIKDISKTVKRHLNEDDMLTQNNDLLISEIKNLKKRVRLLIQNNPELEDEIPTINLFAQGYRDIFFGDSAFETGIYDTEENELAKMRNLNINRITFTLHFFDPGNYDIIKETFMALKRKYRLKWEEDEMNIFITITKTPNSDNTIIDKLNTAYEFIKYYVENI